jgi:sensor histidine kinase YesM
VEHLSDHINNYLNPRHFLTDLLYTIILCVLIALFLTLTGIGSSFVMSLVMSQSFGICICSIITLLVWLFKPEKVLSLAFIVAAGIAGGIFIGLQIGPFILERFFSVVVKGPEKSLFRAIILCIAFGSVISYFFYAKSRLSLSQEMIQQERIKRLSSEKEALEAKLRLLQAQIEPHFLFNTLSNVLSLIDTDPTKGKFMLTDLIHYLRTSLSRTLPDTTTLDQEIEIIRAYLNIQKIRMGERLHFTIEVPDTARLHPFPPMLLQPLVENAVKHGLEPQMDGGEIIIKAMEQDDVLRIEAVDTGPGFSSFQKTGVGIANVRERIQLLYGKKGRLILEENKPHGIRAIIEVPKDGV